MTTEYRVPTVRTTPSMDDFARAALKVLPSASKETIGVLWAQFALETARGVHCYGWNIGNRKDVVGDGLNYHVLGGVWEIVNGEKVYLAKDDPGSRFVAFSSLDEGMRHHIEFIRRPGYRYEKAWKFAELGDYAAYARSLGASGYYTAKPEDYVKHGLPHFAEWMRSQAYEQARASLLPHPDALYTAAVTAPNGLNLRVGPSIDSVALRQMGRGAIVQVIGERTDWLEVVHNGQRGFASSKWLARTKAPLTTTEEGLVEVTCRGERWLVFPIPIAPVSIGEAARVAREMGFQLPTPDIVDAFHAVADLKIDGAELVEAAGADRLTRLNAPETHARVRSRLGELVGARSLGKDFFLMSAFKLVVSDPLQNDALGLYGLFDARGVPIQGRDAAGRVYTKHAHGHIDWSQAMQPVKRAS